MKYSIKNELKTNIIILSGMCMFIALSIVSSLIYIGIKEKQEQRRFLSSFALDFCNSVLDEDKLFNYTTSTELKECENVLINISSKKDKVNVEKKLNKSKNYLSLNDEINEYYYNGVTNYSISSDEIENLYSKLNNLEDFDEIYLTQLSDKISLLEQEQKKYDLAKDSIEKIYDIEKNSVKIVATRKSYNEAKNYVNDLQKTDSSEMLTKYLNEIDVYLTKMENSAYQERKKYIQQAWVKLKVPYISQNLNKVYNGCEVASLLMALKYKNYLTNMSIVEYAQNLPKTDNPNTGFYLSVFDREPTGISHWIAPQPLVDYGISSSGNKNIINATGWTIEQLADEILKGNPVVIYLTVNFKEPRSFQNGAPVNLHVQLLTGYNPVSEEYFITDPIYRDGKYEYVLSKNKINDIYKKVGSKAVVVR